MSEKKAHQETTPQDVGFHGTKETSISKENVRLAIQFLSSIELDLDKINKSTDLQGLDFDRRTSKRFTVLRQFFDRQTLQQTFSNIVPVIVAVAIAIFAANLYFEAQRTAARAKITVQFVELIARDAVSTLPLRGLINSIIDNTFYTDFLTSTMGRFDFRTMNFSEESLNQADTRNLFVFTSRYHDFLDEKAAHLVAQKEALRTLPPSEMRIEARKYLDSIFGLSDDDLAGQLTNYVASAQDELESVIKAVNALKLYLERPHKEVLLRMHILNAGATDGLIRHVGGLQVGSSCFAIGRVTTPRFQTTPTAVPTFAVNQAEDFFPQSVGKLEKDSMSEYWFRMLGVSPGGQVCDGPVTDGSAISIEHAETDEFCSHQETAFIYLFDQMGDSITGSVTCNPSLVPTRN